jgi:hypothetical protein
MCDSLRVLYTSQRGGTLINADNPNKDIIGHIHEFMDHADKIQMLGTGSYYGTNYKVSIPKKGKYKSPFYSSDFNTIGRPVTTILLKFVLLSELRDQNYWINGVDKSTMTRKSFMEEIETQQIIYSQTSMLGSAVTVSILGAIEGSTTDIEEHVLTSNKTSWKGLNEMFRIARNFKYTVGVICMEFLESYQTVDSYMVTKVPQGFAIDNDKFHSIIGQTCYHFIRMFSLGFFHFDAHLNNVMIDPNTSDYLIDSNTRKPVKGRIVFIDFGRVLRIQKNTNFPALYKQLIANMKELQRIMNIAIKARDEVEFTNSYINSVLQLFFNLDITGNSIYNTYFSTYGSDYGALTTRVMDAIEMRYNRIEEDYHQGKFRSSSENMDNAEHIELLNLPNISKLADRGVQRKYDFMSVIHCYEGDMCMKIPIKLTAFLGIDPDTMLLSLAAKGISTKKDATKYIMAIYNQSIAPKSVIDKLAVGVASKQQIEPTSPKKQPVSEKRSSKKPRELKPCKEGQIRNPKTNRCISEKGRRRASPAIKILRPCKEGQIRNPKTDRCVSKSGKVGKSLMRDERSK